MHKSHVMSGGRYPVLRSLAIIYVLGAALAVLGAIVGAVYALTTNFDWADRLVMALATLAGGFLLVISMLAIAEVLKLFIDMEHNTRMGAAGRVGVPVSITPQVARDGADGHVNRLDALDEETAEAALIRGH